MHEDEDVLQYFTKSYSVFTEVFISTIVFSILFLQLFKYLKQMCMETLYVLSFDVELTLSINESIYLDHIIYCLSSKDKAYRSKTISIMWSLSVS